MHYLIAMLILMVTLFWALWDEAYGQRPWKAFQEEWQHRYTAFLDKTHSKSQQSIKDVEQNPEYRQLAQAADDAEKAARPRKEELQKQISDYSAKILAVQAVFTDKRAYANALTYEIETDSSASGKKSKQKDLDEYKKEQWTVEYPDGHKEKYDFAHLEEKYNELKDERSKLSAELGDVLKPVNAARQKADEYISDHMDDLAPTQIEGLKNKASEAGPTILHSNVASANLVDRCESCHVGII